MQRPGGDPPQFRHEPPTATPSPAAPPPLPTGFHPEPMNMGFPLAPYAMHNRGPMMPPPQFPGGKQRPGFRPPLVMPQPYGVTALPPGQPMPAAPPIHMMSSQPAPGTIPPRPPPPPGLLPVAGPQVAPLGQPSPGMAPGALSPRAPHPVAPSLNSSSSECSPFVNSSLPLPSFPQGSQGHLLATTLPPPPQKTIDDEVVRNIEILSQFVAKNGPIFENMDREKEARNSKFSFLFGGEPGSDAAIGHDYFHWFKMKCQIEQSMSKKGEGVSLFPAPLLPFDSNQQPIRPILPSGGVPIGPRVAIGVPAGPRVATGGLPTGPKVSSGVSSTFSVVSDMEMDMDMEDLQVRCGHDNYNLKCYAQTSCTKSYSDKRSLLAQFSSIWR